MIRSRSAAVAVLFLILTASRAWCLSPEQQLALVRLARAEQDRGLPLPAGEAARRAAACRTAWQQVTQYFDKAPRERANWQRLVDTAELAGELQASEPDARRLLVLSKQFYAPRDGLELAPVLQLRTALDRYVDLQTLTAARSPADLQQERSSRLVRIADLLQASRVDQAALRDETAWLATLQQSPLLVTGLQQKFGQPNLIISISRDLLPALADRFQRDVARDRWASSIILGNRVEGMTHFRGTMSGQPAAQRANTIELALTGQIQSPHNTAYAGKYQIYSQGQTAIQAQTRITWDGTQFVAEPAQVSAQTSSALTGASVNRRRLFPGSRIAQRIDNRIAGKVLDRASESLPQARQEAAGIASARIAQSFNGEIQQRLAELNRNAQHYYTHPLVRVGMLPKSSGVLTASGAELRLQFPGRSGLAAESAPAQDLQGDINVQIHESAFPNLIQHFAGGGIWRDDFFAYIQKEALGDNEVELRIREHSDRWAVQLDRLNPWSTRIDRNGVRFTLAVAAYWINGRERQAPFTLQCSLAPFVAAGNEHGWQRVGDVKITGDLASADREFLRRKFNGFFASRFHLDGFAPPAGGAWDDLSTMRLRKLQLADGWLGLEFRQLPSEARKVALRVEP